MRSIKKLKSTGKAVAGSALLVGATLTGAAGFAAAQDSGSNSMDLGDYPQPFVNDDGEVDSTIVVGSQGKVSDVVGAINVAGSLGNAAFAEEEQSVSVEGSFGWSASNGVTLDTRNDNLHFGDSIDTVRQTLTEDHLDVLETNEVLSGDEEQDVEQYLYLGNQDVQFGTPGDTQGEEDPFFYVNNPATVDSGENNHLYELQANFQDGVQFANDAGDNRNDDVYGEEITLFGTDYTVADSAFSGDGQLVLYGSSQELDVSNGESETVTVNEEEHTVETVAVTDSNAAAVRVDGSLEQVEEGDEFDVGGETLRVDAIIDTGDNGAGVVQFAIGSEKVTLEDGEPVMTGSDDEEVEGTHVTLSGSGFGSDATAGNSVELSSVSVAVGADDSDNSYVRAGEAFEDPVFNDVEFHFGGLNPDATSDSDNVGEVEFGTDGDETATVSISDGDNDATVGFAYAADGTGTPSLADSDGEDIHVQEGVGVQEDEYFVSDAGDFSHMWQVTSIDVDDTNDAIDGESEGTVELEDQITGASVEVDLDSYDNANSDWSGGTGEYYRSTEVIDGQTYKFAVDETGTSVYTGWDSSASFNNNDAANGAINTGNRVSLYAAQDTDSGAAVSFTKGLTSLSAGNVYELPSTESTDAQVVEVTDSSGDVDIDVGNNDNNVYSDVTNQQIEVGGVTYRFYDTGSSNFDLEVVDGTDTAVDSPAAVAIQPQDESDNEEAYVVEPEGTGDNQIEVGGGAATITYTGGDYSSAAQTLESDDDVDVSVNSYGAYTEQNTDEQGSFTLNIPDGQATAGAAVTGAEGSLEASASGSGTVTTQTPTGWPDSAALDSEVSGSDRNQDLILVGGPAVNTLVEELASENKTWTADDYEEDTWVLDLVEGFSDDTHALVVAGYGSEDTTAAASYISNYADHQEELAGKTTKSMTTSASSQ